MFIDEIFIELQLYMDKLSAYCSVGEDEDCISFVNLNMITQKNYSMII